MFQSVEELSQKLSETGYFIDPTMTKVVFLADQMKKPLLLEGPAGSGKTQLAISVAAAAGTHVERLQCYRGVSEEQAIGRFDESLQRLYMEYAKGQHGSWKDLQTSLKGRDFFRAGTLNFNRIVAKIGKGKRLAQLPAVGVKVRSHPPVTFWGKFAKLRNQRAVFIE